MDPLAPANASWLKPAAMSEADFARVRERLARCVSHPHATEVYAANRRSIYVIDDDELGRVAVKETRHDGFWRRMWFRGPRAAKALCEYRVSCEFEARGGRTPHVWGAALDRTPFALRRVLVFIAWLDDVQTLTEYFRALGDPPDRQTFERVGDALVAAARVGLVHGRHGSDNVLVDRRDAVPQFYTIDFAYSHLTTELDPPGFRRDVARIAHWLWHEKIWADSTVERFLATVAGRAWPDEVEVQARAMTAELERWQRLKPRRSAQERGDRTM
jgi:tRNA A-37 threonylcarbamoyl transferase component Bud32